MVIVEDRNQRRVLVKDRVVLLEETDRVGRRNEEDLEWNNFIKVWFVESELWKGTIAKRIECGREEDISQKSNIVGPSRIGSGTVPIIYVLIGRQ